MHKRLVLFAGVCAAAASLPGGALAHKLKAFATVEGPQVSGYAYFAPGGRAQDSNVKVTLPDGSVVATMTTDDTGSFHFTPTVRADYTILVDAGDGHEATYRIAASELSDSTASANTVPIPAPVATPPVVTVCQPAGSPPSAAEIRAMVELGIAHQVRPLREQIDAWQEKVWLHDVLGGLGYIIGLAGLAYGLSEGRRSRRDKTSPQLQEARR
jgi:nickel transport protein